MRLLLSSVASLALLLLSGAHPVIPPALVGEWVNMDANTKSVTKLIVSDGGDIHAYGKCSPTDCDWKSVGLEPRANDEYKAEFKTPFEVNTLNIRWVRDSKYPDGLLHVKDNTWHAAQNGGRAWSKDGPELIFDKPMKRIVIKP